MIALHRQGRFDDRLHACEAGETPCRAGWHGDLLYDLTISLARNLAGIVGDTVLGMAAGTLLGLSRAASLLVLLSFNGLRQIAIFAWIPLIFLWFGFGDTAKVVLIMISAFTPVVLNTFEGVRSAPPSLIEVGPEMRFTRWQLVTRLCVPAALPSILTGVHLALICAWVAAIGAKYLMTVGPGIGGLIIAGRERFETGLVLLGMILPGVVGFLINRLVSLAETRLLRWSAEAAK